MSEEEKPAERTFLSTSVYGGVRVRTGEAAKRYLEQAQESLRKIRAKQAKRKLDREA